jgi:GT2 family glycosyltransferase
VHKLADVSIIIPNHIEASACNPVLESIVVQTSLPLQVIVVRSGTWDEKAKFWEEWTRRFKALDVSFEVIFARTKLNPGAARNLGLEYAKAFYIGYLDIQTIPTRKWLEAQLKKTEADRAYGAFGFTLYTARSVKSMLIRDAIYGRRGLTTIPGSIIRRSTFLSVGLFIPNLRAAEDTEWIIRARNMHLKIVFGSIDAPVEYVGLLQQSVSGILRKWHRNHLASRELQHLKVQRVTFWLVSYMFLSLVSFNWNSIVAGWETDSPLYISHVTKIATLTPLALYVFFRGYFIPHRRGVPIKELLPFRFFLLAVVGAALDVIKMITLLPPKESTNRRET